MIVAAIQSLKERSGFSRQAILKYIMANYKLGKDMAKVKYHLNKTLVSAVKAGTLQQSRGTGACGSFRIPKKAAAKVKPKKQATKPVATAKKTLAKR
nr:hypothetical protein BaRGS_031195 [Batillaria attramentaria]